MAPFGAVEVPPGLLFGGVVGAYNELGYAAANAGDEWRACWGV